MRTSQGLTIQLNIPDLNDVLCGSWVQEGSGGLSPLKKIRNTEEGKYKNEKVEGSHCFTVRTFVKPFSMVDIIFKW